MTSRLCSTTITEPPDSINLCPNGQRMALASYSPLKKPILESDGGGLATVCVFGWEEDGDDIHRRMLDRITSELAS